MTPGVPGLGTWVSSGRASHFSENTGENVSRRRGREEKEEEEMDELLWAASVTERSRDFGINMLILFRRFSRKPMVFSICAAVERRLSVAIRFGIKYALIKSVLSF